MANLSAVFHWHPSEMRKMGLSEIMNWHKLAGKRAHRIKST